MHHYEFPPRFRAIYEKAVTLYQEGKRGAESFFTPEEQSFLAANGIAPQHVYDYAEDHNHYAGEPGCEHALAIELVRRDYFLQVQGGQPSGTRIDKESLPAKTDAVRGVAWLPRLLPKARAKLRGELPDALMFCCGGDRNFFKAHNILPAEFLTMIWRQANDDAAIIDWVIRRRDGK